MQPTAAMALAAVMRVPIKCTGYGPALAAEVAMAAAVPVQASARAVPMVALAVPVAQQYKRNTIVHRQQAMWVAMARTAVRLPRWARSIYMMAPRLSPPRQIFMEVARAQPAAMEVPGAAML